MRTFLRTVLATLVATAALLALAEIAFRAFLGLPRGTFAFTEDNPSGLWPANASIRMEWGSIPYTVKSNSLGFRGEEFPRKKEAGETRVAVLGDSVVDGYSLDNEDTFPVRLERILRGRGAGARVINAARGGGSIDRELAVLKELVVPLDPDVVLLVFVTNDIHELMGRPLPRLLSYTLEGERKRTGPHRWLITRTALGELLTDLWLRLSRRDYRAAERMRGRADRYDIPGNTDFAGNAALFHELYDATDGLVLREPVSAQVKAAVSNYLLLLREMESLCRKRGIRFALAYYPPYPQVYETGGSMWMRDTLGQACRERSVPFLDLTGVMRAHGKIPLYLAPLDFHPSPKGNEVTAAAAADFLMPLFRPPVPVLAPVPVSAPTGRRPASP